MASARNQINQTNVFSEFFKLNPKDIQGFMEYYKESMRLKMMQQNFGKDQNRMEEKRSNTAQKVNLKPKNHSFKGPVPAFPIQEPAFLPKLPDIHMQTQPMPMNLTSPQPRQVSTPKNLSIKSSPVLTTSDNQAVSPVKATSKPVSPKSEVPAITPAILDQPDQKIGKLLSKSGKLEQIINKIRSSSKKSTFKIRLPKIFSVGRHDYRLLKSSESRYRERFNPYKKMKHESNENDENIQYVTITSPYVKKENLI